MNQDTLIRLTNRVAIYATAALIYWAFIFLLITVFDLKIFREHMTETFFLSLVCIFAILGGAIVLNLMSNLSKISSAISSQGEASAVSTPSSKKWLIVLALSFPLIAVGLFSGNALSEQKKRAFLVNSAEKIVAENHAWLASVSQYKFSNDFASSATENLNVIRRIDENFPEVMLIVPDEINGKSVFLAFGNRNCCDEKEKIEKSTFIFSASHDEREYLKKVFATDAVTYRFHAEKGNYQLYFPTIVSGKKMVLYFSDYQRYGKLGS